MKAKQQEPVESLVQKIIDGDRSAETAVVHRYQAPLMVVLYNSSKDRVLAEDIAQDTWIIVLEKIRNGDVREPKQLAAFIRQVGKNQLIMRYRKNEKDKYNEQVDDDKSHSTLPTPEQNIVNKQLNQSIGKLFEELRQPRDRDLLKRFYITADTKEDLCHEYGLTGAHFDRVLHRARERFKKLWKESQQ